MTDVDLEGDLDTATPGGGGRGRRGIAIIVTILLLAGAAGLALWFLRPDALEGPGNRVGTIMRPGEHVLLGTWIDPKRDIELVSIRPIKPPPAGATVTFHGCVLSGDSIGSANGEPESECRDVLPINGLRIRKDEPTDPQIIVRIEMTEPGTYASPGFLVTYRDGIRGGTEQSGTAFTVRAKPGYTPPG
jgi:hypothetical protein